MTSYKKAFLSLVRTEIGHRDEALPPDVDWKELKDLAVKQGVDAIALDGIENLPEGQRPPKGKFTVKAVL